MKSHPILFNAQMVRAILAGEKTQTRRVVKAKKDRSFGCMLSPNEISGEVNNGDFTNSRYKAGNELWVRETFSKHPNFGEIAYRADGDEFEDADGSFWEPKWTPSIFMPRKFSRITLTIKSVHIERLNDISDADAKAEGVGSVEEFKALWCSINGAESWDKCPWVWVIEFERK